MNNQFSLLSLNSDMDKHPRSWIGVSGKSIKNIVAKLENEIIGNKQINREKLSKLISTDLNCNHVSIKNLLRGVNSFYPIPFLLKMCKLSQNPSFYMNLFEENIIFLKVNSASAKPVRAVKELSKDIAKIIGAFCADGSLSAQFIISSKQKAKLESLENTFSPIKWSKSRKEFYISSTMNKDNYFKLSEFSRKNTKYLVQTHYTVELTDEHKTNVEAFNKWIFNEFRIKPTSFYNRNTAWRTVFSNKILARYLIKIFGFFPGYKTDFVSEPSIIKKSKFDIRKEFAKGTIMFDGCVTKRKTISFSTISRGLANSIKDILEEDGLKVGISLNKRGEYSVYTFSNSDPIRLLEYFEVGTKKWELLKWLLDKNFESKQIKYEKDLKSTRDVYELLKKIRVADANTLKDAIGCRFITIRSHLIILRNREKIRLSKKPNEINEFVSNRSTVFLKGKLHNKIFESLLEKFRTYDSAAKFLEINKATLSAWKVRKNRIPLYQLENICKILDVSKEEINKNIEEIDREIAEII